MTLSSQADTTTVFKQWRQRKVLEQYAFSKSNRVSKPSDKFQDTAVFQTYPLCVNEACQRENQVLIVGIALLCYVNPTLKRHTECWQCLTVPVVNLKPTLTQWSLVTPVVKAVCWRSEGGRSVPLKGNVFSVSPNRKVTCGKRSFDFRNEGWMTLCFMSGFQAESLTNVRPKSTNWSEPQTEWLSMQLFSGLHRGWSDLCRVSGTGWPSDGLGQVFQKTSMLSNDLLTLTVNSSSKLLFSNSLVLSSDAARATPGCERHAGPVSCEHAAPS